MARSTLENVVKQFGHDLKAGANLRVRRKNLPDIAGLTSMVSEILEGEALASLEPEILAALKNLLSALKLSASDLNARSQSLTGPSQYWDIFEEIVVCKFDELTSLMRTRGYRVSQVRNFKLARSAFHATNAIMVVLCTNSVWDEDLRFRIAASFFVGSWLMELLKQKSDTFKRAVFWLMGGIVRDGEQNLINSATWFMTALFIMCVSFPLVASSIGTLALGLGDPAAALFGTKFGTTKIYRKKTLEGCGGFFLVSFLGMACYLYLLNALTPSNIALLSTTGAFTGAVAELYCSVIDDNLLVPVATASVVTIVMQVREISLPL